MKYKTKNIGAKTILEAVKKFASCIPFILNFEKVLSRSETTHSLKLCLKIKEPHELKLRTFSVATGGLQKSTKTDVLFRMLLVK